MAQILVLNGPNLNLLGTREPQHYGSVTLADIEKRLDELAEAFELDIEFFQHNHEGTLIDLIHEAGRHEVDFIIFNPAAFTHTSVALRDALKAVDIPFIEVHLSNIHRREAFRRHSYFSDIAVGTISGLGATGYELALIAAHQHLTQSAE
ncbi:type II 3-dehydroquinate dehydratase [Suttonella indologenes]|uniref:3-dehydroquinate dehydratase n=1 Tax=Suttonella indologenes TaxID=13276 RepID=A0A380MKM6_9GAMM|nr:type II 3-dehydroquinate dehydratase [Suttonella indologenes]SUO92505.1 3-dehydroquinate dehydratase [Suttonella indologenes]